MRQGLTARPPPLQPSSYAAYARPAPTNSPILTDNGIHGARQTHHGQVEPLHRTSKAARGERSHGPTAEPPRSHRQKGLAAYNFTSG